MSCLVDFERRYRTDPDPWRYATSPYEQEKYAATLAACGPGPFQAALELGSSIGVFTAQLAGRCRKLTSIDLSPTAVKLARPRLEGHPNVDALVGRIPDDLPDACFDLIVASEVLYYLTPDELSACLGAVRERTSPGSRLVCVHWRAGGPERPLDADRVHDLACRQPWLKTLVAGGTDLYRLDVLERT